MFITWYEALLCGTNVASFFFFLFNMFVFKPICMVGWMDRWMIIT